MRNRLRTVALALLLCLVCGCDLLSQKQRAIDHYVRSQLLADQGDLDAALAELREAIKADPSLSVAFSGAGDIHRRRGNYDLARHYYETACQSNPYAFRPHYNLGTIYQQLADNAAEAVERAQQYLRKAVSIYLRAVTIQPADFDANLNLSACYFQLGKYDLAEQYCRTAIGINPNSPHAWSNMGIICDSQNRLYDAIKAYKTSLERDTHQSNILLNLGSTYVRQGRTKAGLHAFELAAREAPDDPAPCEQMGQCLYQLRRLDEALDAYQKAIGLNPDSASAHRGVGVVYMTQFLLDHKNGRLREKALAAWNISLEIEPHQDDLVKLVQKYTPKFTGPQL